MKYSHNSGSVISIILKCGSIKKFVSSLKLFNHNESVNSVDSSVLMAGKLYEARLGKHSSLLSESKIYC